MNKYLSPLHACDRKEIVNYLDVNKQIKILPKSIPKKEKTMYPNAHGKQLYQQVKYFIVQSGSEAQPVEKKIKLTLVDHDKEQGIPYQQ